MLVRKMMLVGAAGCALVVATAGAASAERAAKSNGVGVCLSQVALDTSDILGFDRLGIALSGAARSGELAPLLSGSRNSCGEPPGPGHLG
jgi:hypothetical protein